MNDSQFSGYHKKTFQERHNLLKAMMPELNGSLLEGGLDAKTADLMIENCIGKLSLPLGLGLYFRVNARDFLVPMCTEEPSIVAAACGAAKLIQQHGGFLAKAKPPVMRGQIQILQVPFLSLENLLSLHKGELMEKCNLEYCSRMKERGGGVVDIQARELEQFHSVLEVFVNVCEAMGANVINSICESLSKDILHFLPQAEIGLKILSNFCVERTVKVRFKLPISSLGYKGLPGIDVASKLIQACRFAEVDPFRACTHNKGIMNGIVAVAQATGQDTRSIEAAAHAFASRKGRYTSLTKYFIQKEFFIGSIKVPLAVGTQGGAIRSNIVYGNVLHIMNYPSSSELAQVMASVGLACNFAALRAMVTEGIQKGHMSLHAKNIAIGAGVPNELVYEVVEYMKQRKSISKNTALDYMQAHHMHTTTRHKKQSEKALCTFYANLEELEPPQVLSIGFNCRTLKCVHVYIDKSEVVGKSSDIKDKLFGKHTYNWFVSFFGMINKVKYKVATPRQNLELRVLIKVVTIWLNVISFSIVNVWEVEKARKGLEAIMKNEDFEDIIESAPDHIQYALYLSRELWHVLKYRIDSCVSSEVPFSDTLAGEILAEVRTVIESNVLTHSLSGLSFEEFFEYRKKQMCASAMLLIDYLGCTEITIRGITQLKQLGKILETISTAKRDFQKHDSVTGTPNAYGEWVKHYSNTPKKYFEFVQGVIAKDKKDLSDEARAILAKAEKLIEIYYTNPRL